jgi:leucyl/phenylalanyl-tRNA--protein transferase
MVLLNEQLVFPPVEMADEHGILAIGGTLSTERLLLAYRSGIFPWYSEGDPILWWCPDPRCVLFPGQLKISRSMQTVLNNGRFRFTTNRDFEGVIQSCKTTPRQGQQGTWISPAIQHAYTKLHHLGHAHSAEAWLDGELVGGLYGIRMGNIFFGESMFSKQSNASKFAFIRYVQQLGRENLAMVDCQVYTRHLETLGATLLPRKKFMAILAANG